MKSKCEWYVKRDGAMFRGYVDCKLEDGTEYTWRSVPIKPSNQTPSTRPESVVVTSVAHAMFE